MAIAVIHAVACISYAAKTLLPFFYDQFKKRGDGNHVHLFWKPVGMPLSGT
jgi:hypothetical protein